MLLEIVLLLHTYPLADDSLPICLPYLLFQRELEGSTGRYGCPAQRVACWLWPRGMQLAAAGGSRRGGHVDVCIYRGQGVWEGVGVLRCPATPLAPKAPSGNGRVGAVAGGCQSTPPPARSAGARAHA